ncbi:tRNA wybutosine-synthesizing protein 5 [Geodia barretti]|uniref:tRNA wybutosine-synthesizing protein 5 n=1 Tax=Geodia barretti TaxID=519541 RepID=A0AA35RJK7_GEOBA|nr:tRNA wybutosine-synthesizing protein 5 [Geodia barretti]
MICFFLHRTLPFSELVKRANEKKHEQYFLNAEEKYYLRSLGDDPRKDVADIRSQFPELSGDIHLPIYCSSDRVFSCVLRIGSPHVQLWTHYDVMDNLLVQVTGRKRVVLFNPRDANNLYLTGDKSRVLDIDSPDLSLFPRFSRATRHECVLEPGDVLFIPALWFHNVVSVDFGVAVNVFWQNLDEKLYDSRDTYGNKDPLPAQRAQQILDRALKTLEELPDEYRDFYARRLVSRIEEKSYMAEPS